MAAFLRRFAEQESGISLMSMNLQCSKSLRNAGNESSGTTFSVVLKMHEELPAAKIRGGHMTRKLLIFSLVPTYWCTVTPVANKSRVPFRISRCERVRLWLSQGASRCVGGGTFPNVTLSRKSSLSRISVGKSMHPAGPSQGA